MRRRVVVAIALAVAAVATWFAVLANRAPASTQTAEFTAGPTPMPPASDAAIAPDARVLDGPIIDLGYGFELTVPSYFVNEKVPGVDHSVTFMDEGRRIRVAAVAVPASKPRRHADPLDGARRLAENQRTKITHFETTADGTYVVFEGRFENTTMRQHLITRRTARGRASVWVILLDTGIDHPENLALIDELRTGGRFIAR